MPVQPVRVGAKLSSSKSPHGKLIDVQDPRKSSEPEDMELHIESQVGKGSNILFSKVSPVSHSSNKSSLGDMYRSMQYRCVTKQKAEAVDNCSTSQDWC